MNIKDEIQIYIKVMINTSKWLPGEFIPSEHKLSEKFFCSRLTIRSAYQNLVKQGYLFAEHGVGYRVNNHFLAAIKKEKINSKTRLFNSVKTISTNEANIFKHIKTKNISVNGDYGGYIKEYYDQDDKYKFIKAYVNTSLVHSLDHKEINSSVAYFYLERNILLAHRKRIILARKLNQNELIEFNIKKNQLFIITYSILIDKNNQLIEYSVAYSKPNYTEIYCDQELK